MAAAHSRPAVRVEKGRERDVDICGGKRKSHVMSTGPPLHPPNMMCKQYVSTYWHLVEGQQTTGPPSLANSTVNPLLLLHIQLLQQRTSPSPREALQAGSGHAKPSSLKLSCTYGRAVEIKQAQGENMKDSPHPPCLPLSPPPSSGVCVTFTLACGDRILCRRQCSSSRTPELSWEVPLLRDFSSLTSCVN